jgi:hypothetical protein
MYLSFRYSATVAVVVCLSACATTTPVPGADKVRITDNPSDVRTCTAAGNIKLPTDTLRVDIQTEFRNRVVGLGGNTALLTKGSPLYPAEGVAYRCP